jgi:hypothetical protein
MIRFFQYSAELFVRPRKTLGALHGDSHRVSFGILGHLLLAVVYFFAITIPLTMDTSHLPEFLVLNIPAGQYYAYERFFILPVGIAATILTSGVIRLIARVWDGQGQFEDHFALLGFSLIVVAVIIGLPDLVIGILVGNGILLPLGWTFIGPHVWLGTIWYMLLVLLAVKEIERLSWMRSIVLALIGFAANGMVQFIFIR